MATWNTDNPKTTNQILEDVADIEENFQELHDVVHAITHGTLGTTTAADFRLGDTADNAMNFPLNNQGAATIMIGDPGAGNNTMWMYLNAAPTGWKVSATGGDTVLAISGGAGDYNVNGGNPDTSASWDHSAGLTKDAHTHSDGTLAVASHVHTVTHPVGGDILLADGVNYPTNARDNAINTGAATPDVTGATGAQSDSGISSDSSWRPSASVGKLYDLDTA